jgi:hypothetical protein
VQVPVDREALFLPQLPPMNHPLQEHFDYVANILRRLGSALKDTAAFQDCRHSFDEYLAHNELELARCIPLAMLFCRPSPKD